MSKYLPLWSCFLAFSFFAATVHSHPAVPELTAEQLKMLLESWETDVAVMFYAPWCKGCKQLRPIWDDIGRQYAKKESTRLMLSRFNCEKSLMHGRLCNDLFIDRYPAFAFIGYGNMRQGNGRVALFEGPLTSDNIREWVQMLSYVSYFQRLFNVTVRSAVWPFGLDKIWGRSRQGGTNAYGGSTYAEGGVHAEKEKTAYGASNANTGFEQNRHANDLSYGDEYLDESQGDGSAGDDEWIDLSDLRDYGDVFKQLHDSQPAPSNLALRYCAGGVAQEYCIYVHHKENEDGVNSGYCGVVAECLQQEMRPDVCRPEVCPFDKPGCSLVSMCLVPEVIEQYQELLDKQALS